MINIEQVEDVQLALLRKQLAELTKEQDQANPPVQGAVKKNQRPGKADPTRKYVLLAKSMQSWGKVPQQQADVAAILSKGMELNREYAEPEVFAMLVDGSGEYPSLCKSKQDPTYVFRYYRGLKNDGVRAGFVARNFIKG
jgi:hypothetical protein